MLDETASDLPDVAAPLPMPETASALPESLLRIPVTVQIVLGSVRLPLSQVAELKAGSTVTLDQALGAPVTVMVNGKAVARGDLFVLEGEGDRLGVTITDLTPAAI